MRTKRKLPTKQLEKYSTIFMHLSLVLVLFIVYLIIEHQIEQKPISETFNDSVKQDVYVVDNNYVFSKEAPKAEKIEPKQQTIVDLTILEKESNDKVLENTVLDPQPEDSKIKINTALNNLIKIDGEDPKDDKMYFDIVEYAPIYKGCEGLSKEESKKCFIKKIQQFVIAEFNGELAQDLGLNSGKHKMFAQFIIDTNGYITEVVIKAPHPTLKNEVTKIIKKIPQFTPGKQGDKVVNVKFTLPITFKVE